MLNRFLTLKASIILFILGFTFALLLTYSYSSNYKIKKLPARYQNLIFRNIFERRSPAIIESFILKSNDTNFVHKNKEIIFVAFIFTNVKKLSNLKQKFYTCLSSLTNYTTSSLSIVLISDLTSIEHAKDVFMKIAPISLSHIEVDVYSVHSLALPLESQINFLRPHFSHESSYYNDALFYLSTGLDQVLPQHLSQIILIDIDVKFQADIYELWQHFKKFDETTVIGLAHEQQPVYRHLLYKYIQKKNKENVRAGMPPPDGNPGFNSGVLLLDLDKMRNLIAFRQLLNASVVDELVNKYMFQGHLGDQDLYSLLSFEHAELFYVLPCNWNRQLCQWWKNHGYEKVFEKYHACKEKPKLLHGNCNTYIQNVK